MNHAAHERRPLGNSAFEVSPVALGCWPIAGVTTLDATEADSIATIQKCFDVGINHLDTAHVYGPNGESENLIRRALAGTGQPDHPSGGARPGAGSVCRPPSYCPPLQRHTECACYFAIVSERPARSFPGS